MTYQEDQDLRTAQVENNHRVFMHTHDVAQLPTGDKRPSFDEVHVVHVSYDSAEVNAGLGANPNNVYLVTVQLPNGVSVTVAADGTVQTSDGITDRWYAVRDDGPLDYTHGRTATD